MPLSLWRCQDQGLRESFEGREIGSYGDLGEFDGDHLKAIFPVAYLSCPYC